MCGMEDITRIMAVYHEIDKTIKNLQAATGMHCPTGCSNCCRRQWVEATVPEVLPLAMKIYSRNQEEDIMMAIEEKEGREDSVCVLFAEDTSQSVTGSCSFYDVRPFLCRIFGFGARRNKYGGLDLSTCRIIKNSDPAGVRRAEMAISMDLKVAIYQDLFMRIASLRPGMGYRRLPINLALKEAITYLYWMNPSGRK